MRKTIGILFTILIISAGTFLFFKPEYIPSTIREFFSKEKAPIEKILRKAPEKEIETYDLNLANPEITLVKNAQIESIAETYVVPQIGARVVDIKVKVGDKVQKNQTLIKLGDSLNTDLLNLQKNTSSQNLEIQNQISDLNSENLSLTSDSAYIGSQISQNSYENSLDSENSSEEIFETQEKITELSIDTAEEAYKNAKNNYNDTQDYLDELEDSYDELSENPTTTKEELQKLEAEIEKTEAQLENLETAKEASKNGLKQAKLALEQLNNNFDSQESQMEFGSETTYLQYQITLNQLASSGLLSQIQSLSNLAQLIQIESSAKSAQLSLDQLNIKAPINGVISSINIKKENLVSPGQVLMTIEDPQNVKIKTTLSEEELYILLPASQIFIITEKEKIPATITSISPGLDKVTKKFNIELTPDHSAGLTIGANTKVGFKVNPKKHLFVPLSSIFLEDQDKVVKTVNSENIIENKFVELGQIIGEYIEVRSGLSGDEIISKQQSVFLNEGDKIKSLN